ncbi:AraC family transcriptional regulator [Azospirillum agricola]|uniref:AraC family transcriptional regulator n=1 Tax=Azospirillum agricola TaxID=1720247 RepID=UPI000A0F31BF|nr:AraC family transcriptional regulator [Azospirillum agricola]SMH59313.1 transcriptional regulator, AraC family [Azospirillum lipoferum]
MVTTPRLSIDVRSYGADQGADRHDFAQLVLPLSGTLEMDIAGKGDRLGPSRMAFVEAGSPHSQMSDKPNRSLIVDLDPIILEPEVGDRLIRQPFVPLPPAAGKLVDYMGLLVDGGAVSADNLRLWLPLLLDSLVRDPARPPSRLAPLLAVIEPEPGLDWTTGMMAERAGVSVSRLHALFRAELDTTPRAWLAALRLKRVCEWLALSDHPIAEIAYRAGYADQSALTRAMRQSTGLTPAAYRRQRRESRHKNR